jgi:hypothetical protein
MFRVLSLSLGFYSAASDSLYHICSVFLLGSDKKNKQAAINCMVYNCSVAFKQAETSQCGLLD